MNKLLSVIAVSAALLSTSVNAQDLKLDRTGMYVGGTVGSTLDADGRSLVGLVLGSQVHQNLRVEGTYDYNSRDGKNGHALMVNAVPQYRIPGTVITPYALVGAGYGFDALGKKDDAKPVYALGAGVRVGVSTNWELDARYRHVNAFDRSFNDKETHMLTAGATYRF